MAGPNEIIVRLGLTPAERAAIYSGNMTKTLGV